MPRREFSWGAGHAFAIAAAFWAISALLGFLLRLHPLLPGAGLVYGHLLHAHSHVAFLGWVYNAFFALALQHFVSAADRRGYLPLFVVTQVAVLGMLLTYPFQGYGAASITFSTLHMVCAGVFVWKLARGHTAAPAARPYLRFAFGCLLLSALGPLTLGPLAALGLRESPAYLLSIYFYLHFQYNGWFVFFLLAGLVHDAPHPAARRALPWLVAGTVGSFALSALWLQPPAWVWWIAGLSGAALLVGTGYLLPALPAWRTRFPPGAARAAATVAGGCWLVKNLLQAAGALPWLGLLAQQRFIVIAFLHLVFLGVVTPLLLAWAQRAGWLGGSRRLHWGYGALVFGFALSQTALVYPPVASLFEAPAWPQLQPTLVAAAALQVAGVGFVLLALRRSPVP